MTPVSWPSGALRRRCARALLVATVAGVAAPARAQLRDRAAVPVPAPRPHNVLLVVADDVGVDYVGVYGEGGAPATTPVIDGLAAEGVLFRNAWAYPLCSPTRAGLLTGRHPFRHGIGTQVPGDSDVELPASELLLPEALDLHPELGYLHAAFGKWHLGNGIDSATSAGFAEFAGIRGNIDPPWSYDAWLKIQGGTEQVAFAYATTDTVDDALGFVATAPEPWFVYVAFNAAHKPFHEPPPELHTVELPDVDPRDEPVPFFRATIEAMDRELGRLLEGLGGARQRCDVFVLGDNGTSGDVTVLPFDRNHGKRTPYEGGINIPLVVSGPIVEQPGREVGHLVAAVDLFATVLEIAGIDPATLPPEAGRDSVSMLPYLVDPAAPAQRSAVFSQLFEPNLAHPPVWNRWMVRDGRYKLIRRMDPDPRTELYDLLEDPFEQTDLTQGEMTAEQQAALAALEHRLADILGS